MLMGPWGRPRGLRVAAKGLSDIRNVAQRAREMLGIFDHPIDMVDLLENRLRRVGIHFHVVASEDIPGDAARAVPHEGLLLVTVEAYAGIHSGHPSHVLLIPHELGHFALRHVATFARSRDPALGHSMFEDSEIQADQFSHEFVMPARLVRRHCQSVEDIQRTFNVPRKDAQIRYSVLLAEGHITTGE